MFSNNSDTIKAIFVVVLSLVLSACMHSASQNIGDISSLHWGKTDNAPKTVVILPFLNNTSKTNMGTLVRKSFYDSFSSKNYHDLELGEVDSVLKALQNTSSKSWTNLPPSTLGDLFRADFVIYGRVEEFRKIFLVLYSQIALKVEIEMVECKTKSIVFRKTLLMRSHEGGLPLSISDIVLATIRSGLQMKKRDTLDLIDRVNRKLVADIPNPPLPLITPFLAEIQVASFLEKRKAFATSREFEREGLRPKVEAAVISDHLWYRILLGPYYDSSEAKRIRDRIAGTSQFHPILIHYYPSLGNSSHQM
ncbi:MAG: hypothetical protein GWP10_02070 [Nitrospiraceae bacterium]|nr:hypothetical protein [Nitrospiraceae bacterium]